MPIYTYICAHCSHRYDALRKTWKSRPPAKCPECGEKGRQKKQFSTGISFDFRGDGFYVNDYPREDR